MTDGFTPTPGRAPTPPKPRRSRRPLPIGWIATAVIAAAAMGYFLWSASRPIPVRTARAHLGGAVDAVYASGVVEHVRQARVAPVVTAPIRAVAVLEGQRVRPGQTLAQLDDGPQQGVYLQLAAQAAQARAQYGRTHRLFLAGYAAAAADQDAGAIAQAADAAASGARARLEDYRIKAPFDGAVLRRDAEPGDLATVGKALFTIADPTALRLTADVDERDVGRLRVGQEAVVRADAFPGRTFDAVVTDLTPQGDATGRVFRARLSIGADLGLQPGMTVEINMIVQRRQGVLLVPSKALKDGGVFVVHNGEARRRPVRAGLQGLAETEILGGLKAGEAVVLDPPATLKDGARVAPAPPPAPSRG